MTIEEDYFEVNGARIEMLTGVIRSKIYGATGVEALPAIIFVNDLDASLNETREEEDLPDTIVITFSAVRDKRLALQKKVRSLANPKNEDQAMYYALVGCIFDVFANGNFITAEQKDTLEQEILLADR